MDYLTRRPEVGSRAGLVTQIGNQESRFFPIFCSVILCLLAIFYVLVTRQSSNYKAGGWGKKTFLPLGFSHLIMKIYVSQKSSLYILLARNSPCAHPYTFWWKKKKDCHDWPRQIIIHLLVLTQCPPSTISLRVARKKSWWPWRRRQTGIALLTCRLWLLLKTVFFSLWLKVLEEVPFILCPEGVVRKNIWNVKDLYKSLYCLSYFPNETQYFKIRF